MSAKSVSLRFVPVVPRGEEGSVHPVVQAVLQSVFAAHDPNQYDRVTLQPCDVRVLDAMLTAVLACPANDVSYGLAEGLRSVRAAVVALGGAVVVSWGVP